MPAQMQIRTVILQIINYQ